jgi:hypothetical protein
MADIKRLNYFNYQFLVDQDFQVEQAYHLDMRRRHNRALHSWGVAEGFKVDKTDDKKKVSIGTGTAIDKDGQEIVILSDPESLSLDTFAPNTDVYVTIAYGEFPSDSKTFGTVTDNTRMTERPTPPKPWTTVPPTDGSVIVLAKVHLDESGNVDNIDQSVRKMAGTAIPSGAIGANELINNAVIESKLADNAVTNTKIADNAVTGSKIQDGSVPIGKLAPHAVTTALSNDMVLNSTDTTSTAINQPSFTAAYIGTPPPPTVARSLAALNAVSHKADVPGLIVIGAGTSRTPIPSGTNPAPGLIVMGTGVIPVPIPSGTNPAARIDGPLWVNGPVTITGPLQAQGNKVAYVVDVFINASGQQLHTGDVVRLKGTPVTRFYGDNNKIPMTEVTLCDKEHDSMVIGIVDREAPPRPGAPDTRVEPDDPTSIEDGGELLVVTLGMYAHCKVDATAAPIEVGDLLAVSDNPGFAQKAIEPKVGCIIGKALEPLHEGTGYIAVFANIQ